MGGAIENAKQGGSMESGLRLHLLGDSRFRALPLPSPAPFSRPWVSGACVDDPDSALGVIDKVEDAATAGDLDFPLL